MVVEKLVCDRCGEDVKAGGYRVSYEIGNGTLDISIATLDEFLCPAVDHWGEHYCGKEHLMLALNEVIDIKKGFKKNEGSRIQGVKDSSDFQPLNPERIDVPLRHSPTRSGNPEALDYPVKPDNDNKGIEKEGGTPEADKLLAGSRPEIRQTEGG